MGSRSLAGLRPTPWKCLRAAHWGLMANTEGGLGLPPPWPPASPLSGPGLLQELHKPPNSVFPTLSALLRFKAEATFSRQPPHSLHGLVPSEHSCPCGCHCRPQKTGFKSHSPANATSVSSVPTPAAPLPRTRGWGGSRDQVPLQTSWMPAYQVRDPEDQKSGQPGPVAEQGRGLPVTSALASVLGGGRTCAGQVGMQVT